LVALPQSHTHETAKLALRSPTRSVGFHANGFDCFVCYSFLALALMMFENACSSLTLLGVHFLWRACDDTVWPTQQRAGG
jgi:hypothetical protein